MIRNYQSGSKQKAFSRSVCVKKDEYCNKHVNKNLAMKLGVIMQLNLIDYRVDRLGGRVNTIRIKCVLFLKKKLNAEKIVVECDIVSLNYSLFTQSNRLTIREDNLYLHATHHAPSIVFSAVNWIKFT